MYGDGVNGVTGGGEVKLLSKIRAGVSQQNTYKLYQPFAKLLLKCFLDLKV